MRAGISRHNPTSLHSSQRHRARLTDLSTNKPVLQAPGPGRRVKRFLMGLRRDYLTTSHLKITTVSSVGGFESIGGRPNKQPFAKQQWSTTASDILSQIYQYPMDHRIMKGLFASLVITGCVGYQESNIHKPSVWITALLWMMERSVRINSMVNKWPIESI